MRFDSEMEAEEMNEKEARGNKVDSPSQCCEVDRDHMFGLVGIVATVLNLLVVVFIYLYTPV